ncbi:MAG TPA: hypothetical protein V6D19_22040 [Stenomitos sp.]
MATCCREKIVVLWGVFLLGLLFHTQLGLMPLFHGLSVTDSQAPTLEAIAPILWLMLAFFLIPMLAMIATTFLDTRRYRKFHFILSLIYTVLNLSHLMADLWVSPRLWYQILLMFVLFAIGLLLNLVSFQWLQSQAKSGVGAFNPTL